MVESDATAAKGTVNRIGLGKAGRTQSRYLWLQERVAMDHLKVIHAPGKRNRADMLIIRARRVRRWKRLCVDQDTFSWLNAVKVSLDSSDRKGPWSRLRYEFLGVCCEISPRGLLHQQGGVTSCCSIYAQYACAGCATLCFGSSKSPLRSGPGAE